MQSIQEIASDLPEMKIYVMGKKQQDLPAEYFSMDEILHCTLPVPLSKSCRGELNMRDPVCYIYTSGTTGAFDSQSLQT